MSALLLCPPALDLVAMPMPSPSLSSSSAAGAATSAASALATDNPGIQADSEGAVQGGDSAAEASSSSDRLSESTSQDALPLDGPVDPLAGWKFLVFGLDRKVYVCVCALFFF